MNLIFILIHLDIYIYFFLSIVIYVLHKVFHKTHLCLETIMGFDLKKFNEC